MFTSFSPSIDSLAPWISSAIISCCRTTLPIHMYVYGCRRIIKTYTCSVSFASLARTLCVAALSRARCLAVQNNKFRTFSLFCARGCCSLLLKQNDEKQKLFSSPLAWTLYIMFTRTKLLMSNEFILALAQSARSDSSLTTFSSSKGRKKLRNKKELHSLPPSHHG